MTYASEKLKAGRRPFRVCEIDLDYCSLTYATAPCSATLGTTGDHKCFNTRVTCQDSANYTPATKTYRFCDPAAGVSRAFDAVPSLRNVDMAPAQIDPGRSLGKRASVRLDFQDHPHHDRGIDKYVDERISGAAAADSSTYTPYEQGSYFGKLRARNPYYTGRVLRLYTGYLPWDHDAAPDQQVSATSAATLATMRARTYLMDRWDGPDAKGAFRVVAKDTLKLADDDRAKCPVPSTGKLAEDMTDTVWQYDQNKFDTGVAFDGAGLFFSEFGNTMYMRDPTNTAKIRMYSLSTLWDVTTALSVYSFDATPQMGASLIRGLLFSADGTVFLLGIPSQLYRYTLSTPWDLTTATYDAGGDLVLTGEFNSAAGLAANSDGTKLYISGTNAAATANVIYVYNLTTGWDTGGTVAFAGTDEAIVINSDGGFPYDLQFVSDGSRLLVAYAYPAGFYYDPATFRHVQRYDLDTPYDLTSARYAGTSHDYDVTSVDGSLEGLFARTDAAQMFTIGSANGTTQYVIVYSHKSVQTTIDLLPAGIGDAEYDSAGTVRLGDELMTYTRSGDTLTILERGSDKTDVQSHGAGDIVQLCKRFISTRIDSVISDLLENYANIDASYLPVADWSTETAAYLAGYIFDTVIAEPIGIQQLITEIMQQALCYIWWDEIDQEIKFRAIRAAASVATLTGDNAIIASSFKARDTPENRLTRVNVYYGMLSPVARLDDPKNFRKFAQAVDTDAESAVEYADQRISAIYSRWFGRGHGTEAQALADTMLAQYRDNPVDLDLTLDAKDADIWTGDVVTLQHRSLQGYRGEQRSQRAQVLEVEETSEGQFRYSLRTDIFAEP